jgi:L-threonylcarbamoyladenylate synthase
MDGQALERLLAVRQSPSDKRLQVHIGGLEQLASLVAEIPDLARPLMEAYWPGPLTLIFRQKPGVLPASIFGGFETVAIRWPDCSMELALLNACGVPLVAPSANVAGRPPAQRIAEAVGYFGEQVDFYLDHGESPSEMVSTLVDVTGSIPVVVRQGKIVLSL